MDPYKHRSGIHVMGGGRGFRRGQRGAAGGRNSMLHEKSPADAELFSWSIGMRKTKYNPFVDPCRSALYCVSLLSSVHDYEQKWDIIGIFFVQRRS
jgi:hypothetical protein